MTFSLTLFWGFMGGLYFVVQLYSSKSILIPINYSNVIVIDPCPLLRQSTNRLLIDEEYQFLYRKLKSKFIKLASEKKEPSLNKLGINLTAPIVFAHKSSGEMVLIFQLSSQLNFTQFCRKLDLKNQTTKKQGIIFLDDKTTHTPITFKEVNLNNHSIFTVCHQNLLKDGPSYDGRQVSISATLSQFPIRNELYFVPRQRGIRVVLPLSNKWLEKEQLEFLVPFLHTVQQIAIDYQGIAIRNQTVVPLINSVIRIPDSIDRDKFEELISQSGGFQMQPINTSTSLLHYGKTTLFLKELDHHEYFIGIDTTTIERNRTGIIYEVSGKLSLLTKVGGSFISKAAANMLPGFHITRSFTEKLEPVSILLKRESKDDFEVEFKLGVKDNRDLVLEFMNYLLALQEELK